MCIRDSNNAFPDTDLTPMEAKQQLGLKNDENAILFFGRLRPYKGLEDLLAAFQLLVEKHSGYRLIIAGEPKKGSEGYREEIQETVNNEFKEGQDVYKRQASYGSARA